MLHAHVPSKLTQKLFAHYSSLSQILRNLIELVDNPGQTLSQSQNAHFQKTIFCVCVCVCYARREVNAVTTSEPFTFPGKSSNWGNEIRL